MRSFECAVVAALLILGVPAAAQTETSLPIAKGFWTNSGTDCGVATNGYIYDGTRWGSVYFYGPNASQGPVGEFQTITATGAAKDGFIAMQLDGVDGAGYFHVRKGFGRTATLRTGAPSPDGIDVLDDELFQCDFAALSPRMKQAVQRFAPSVAVTAR
jgi:hypothetical protein